MRELVREALIENIVTGELAPGSRPSLQQIADQLEVSVTPVREALVDLEREGLVEALIGRGFQIRPLSAKEIRESYPVIAELESLALRTAPPDPAQLDRLDQINSRFRKAKTIDSLLDLDADWHDHLLAQCTNSTLLEIRKSLTRRVRRYEFAFMADGGRV